MEDSPWAPIAIFIYKRPDHAHRMIESLRGCTGFNDSPVYVFADGPKHTREVPAVEETRSEARHLLGDHAVFLEREANVGVDTSIIEGATQLCESHGRVVVIEDDLVLSAAFLEFVNMGLARYKDEPRVMQVSGYMFDVPELRESNEALFLPMIGSWGWATWKRAWDLFDPVATGWKELLEDKGVRRRFDLDGNFQYARMLSRQMRMPVPAWDIRWYYSLFSRGGLALYPPRSLVRNEGFDGTGTHGRLSLPVRQGNLQSSGVTDFPTQIIPSQHMSSVFKTIGGFRSASPMRKLIAVPKAAIRLIGRR